MQIRESSSIEVRSDLWEDSFQADYNNVISENTPLLEIPQRRRGFTNSALVILVLSLLLTGVSISIYLLVIQFRSDNILPPIKDDLEMVSNKKWLLNSHKLLTLPPQQFKAKRVVVMQTYTDQCDSEVSCIKLLQDMQKKSGGEKIMHYNFLVSSNGRVYEFLGWRPSPLINQDSSSSIIVALIGNFTYTHPSTEQINGVKNFFQDSISKKILDPSFKIIPGDNAFPPKYLLEDLKTLSHRI